MGIERPGEAIEAFKQYSAVFERLDPRGAAPYYNEPALLISPQGIVALLTSTQVEGFLAPLMKDLRTQGYASSEFQRLEEQYLGDDLALVRGVGIWKKTTGEELRRFGLTYTLYRTPASWRIVVAAIHPEP